MQDLIDASDISRGGIYLYFKSVEEVFIEVILQRERTIVEEVEDMIEKELSFEKVFDEYLLMQKERLLNIKESFLRASYEYHLNHQCSRSTKFKEEQMENAQSTIEKIIDYGVKKSVISQKYREQFIQHILIFIEGLNISTLLSTITEDELNQSIYFLKDVIALD